MLKTITEEKTIYQPAPDTHRDKAEITPAEKTLLQDLFRGLNLAKVDKITRGKKLKRKAEVAIKEIGAINRLLQFIRITAPTMNSGELRVELRLTDSDAQLLANMLEYIPIDLLGTDTSPIEYIGYDGPHNFVNHLKAEDELFNKSIKISLSRLVTYLIQQYNLPPDSITIPTLANTEISVYVLGTTKDSVPQSLVFFITGIGRKTRPVIAHLPRIQTIRGRLFPA